jgi:hypothetical protein
MSEVKVRGNLEAKQMKARAEYMIANEAVTSAKARESKVKEAVIRSEARLIKAKQGLADAGLNEDGTAKA